MKITREKVEEALNKLRTPIDDEAFFDNVAVTSMDFMDEAIKLCLVVGYPLNFHRKNFENYLVENLEAKLGVQQVSISISSVIKEHAVQSNLKLLPQVKNVIAVASGKGGVGKSTTAVNLAISLAREGAKVGILDADIYGPSQQKMLGLNGKPESPDGKKIHPMINHGIQAMSIGMLVDEETPMVWRGPMVTGALEQLLRDTLWTDLDYLLVDLPPGTGDVQLTLSQKVPLTGAIIVTTPQDIALIDAKKGLKMFEKVGVPILGIVENMSFHICSQCGHEEPIFGTGGAAKMSSKYKVKLLGQLPLHISVREHTDSGNPTTAAAPDSALAKQYQTISLKVAMQVASLAKNNKITFPKIVIQKS